jgi:predicted enzyme related to lactoylglutathione lyase
MPDIDHYAPGTPSWVDLSTKDLDASAAFYSALLGWDVVDLGPEAGGYRMAHLRGRPVAGLTPMGEFPVWTTYISSDDVDAACERVTAAGGTVMVAPMDVMQAGRMAVVVDPAGAVFGIWQPGEHQGSGIANEPGAFAWNELALRDTTSAAAFYGAVFGWTGETSPMGGREYTIWSLDGAMIAGMVQMDENWAAEMPSHWLTYFAVADADAACATISEHGGAVHVPPMDIPAGRFAAVSDPQGAAFAVIALAPTDA